MNAQQQRIEALARANERRSTGAHYKREVANGRIMPTNAIQNCRESIPVHGLLRSIPKVGDWKANRILMIARVNGRARMGDLTDRQRMAVIEAMHNVAPVTRRV